MENNGYRKKYYNNKDFITNGINEKDKYLNWYVTAIYFSAYYMVCAYYYKIGKSIPRAGQDLYIIDELANDIGNKVLLIENKAKIALYGRLDAMEPDVKKVEDVFKGIESFMSPKIAS